MAYRRLKLKDRLAIYPMMWKDQQHCTTVILKEGEPMISREEFELLIDKETDGEFFKEDEYTRGYSHFVKIATETYEFSEKRKSLPIELVIYVVELNY